MAEPFDLSAAIKERGNEVTPYVIRLDGYDDFTLSPIVTDDTIQTLGDGLNAFLSTLMSPDDYDRWLQVVDDLALDQLVQGRMLHGYFDHIGYDNPFLPDGRFDRSGSPGESRGSNRSSRRAARR